MGAGKGKTRRVQTQIVAAEKPTLTATWLQEKWKDFVCAGGLENVKIHQYYLGSDDVSTDKDYLRMVNELFEDSLLAGAIILPSGYGTNSFTFETIPKKLTGMYRGVKVSFPGSGEGYGETWYNIGSLDRHLRPGANMGSTAVRLVLKDIFAAVEHLSS